MAHDSQTEKNSLAILIKEVYVQLRFKGVQKYSN